MPSNITPLTFAIVEDIEDVATRLTHEMSSYTTWQHCGNAKSVREAKELIANKRPALVFCDWDLVGGSGFEVLQHISSIAQYKPYIVFNTGFQSDHPEIAEELINTYRPDVFINKPYWKKLTEQLPRIVKDAEAKQTTGINQPNADCWITTVDGQSIRITGSQIICIVQSPSNPRQKLVYTPTYRDGLITSITWPEALQLLAEQYIDYFISNRRHSIINRSFILSTEKQFVHLRHLPFKIEIVKEHVKSFYDWLEKGR
jgi:two-component system, LytTR family, response regulator